MAAQSTLLRKLQLSDNVFGLSDRHPDTGMKSQAEGLVEKQLIFIRPKVKKTTAEYLSILSAFSYHGRSEDERPSAWACWSLSYLCIAFPEFVATIRQTNEREYEFRPLPESYCSQVLQALEAAASIESAADGEMDKYKAAVDAITPPSEIPDMIYLDDLFVPEYAACATIPVVYGFAGLLIYLAGKKINEKNLTTVTERRPQNLIDTYKIAEEASLFLTGEGQMGSTAHAFVNQVWVSQDSARRAILTEVAAFNAGTSLAQRVVYTVTKLLENAGMGQATYIHRFLKAMPHAVEFSCVASAISAYAQSLVEVARQPTYIQPYYKVINGDRTRVFHRNAILPLAACAITYETHTNRTMGNFTLAEGSSKAVAMFDAEAARRGHMTIMGLAEAIKGGEDVEEE